MIGQPISHYRITDKLGEGGMGVVYKAEDTKLERTVALKFLAPHLVSDEEIRKRFEREAKAAATLHHPNICTVYEIDEAEGKTFIAMAFIEGQGLDGRIASGPLKLDEALDIAHQISQGLQAAHSKGIVHRDIKPANSMVTSVGSQRQVTIMDFGLAQLTEHSKLTRMDETMGTVAYMSPEQTMGAEVDRRSDIWALGVVLYEMITGQRPFRGHYDKAVMYSITNEEPEPLTALRTGVPMELEWIVGKCLAKEADRRYQTAAELAVDLKNVQEKLKSGRSTILKTSAGAQHATTVGARQAVPGETETEIGTRAQRAVPLQPAWRRALPWALAAVMALALVALAFVHFRETPPDPSGKPLRRFAFTPARFDANENVPVISPNGRHIAYVAGASPTKLWIQDLDQTRPREVEGTEGALRPFWSPGSDFIGYLANDQLKKISVQGGPAITLCALPGVTYQYFGGTWSPDSQSIVFSSLVPTRIFEVPARGGSSKLFIEPKDMEQERSFSAPHFLPGGRGLLYTVGQLEVGQLMLQNLENGEREALGVTASGSRYSPSGHILYTQNINVPGILWALPFSLSSLKATGEAFAIGDNTRWPSVASDGTLVYREEGGPRQLQLVWRNRSGEKLEEISRRWPMVADLTLHPDGRRLAVGAEDNGNRDVWVYDLVRSIWTRVTQSAGLDLRPTWSPSGNHIAFSSAGDTAAPFSIFLKPADGSGKAEPFVPHVTQEVAADWSRDGKHFLFYRLDPRNQRDIWRLEINADGSAGEPVPLLATPFDEREPLLSPDGNWLAYVSNRSGRHEVYVRPFPDGGDQQVSGNGGLQPRWRPDGRELYYVEGDTLMAVTVTTKPSLSIGLPARLFSDPGLPQVLPGGRQYDVAADGQRFLVAAPYAAAGESPAAIRVVENWSEQFRGREQE